MKNRMKKVTALLLAASLTAGLSATAFAEDPGDAAVREQLNISVAAEPGTYDPHMTSTTLTKQILCGNVYEQLVTLNAASEPVPELCESYEVSDDATAFTFHLREGVNFHDGTVMDSGDVAASLNRWIESYSAVGTLLGDARFEAVDDLTVKITTKEPCVTLLYLLAAGAQRAVITTEEAVQNVNEDGTMNDVIGTGPYTFAEWQLDQYVMLEKFENYSAYGDPDQPSDGWAGYKHAYTDKLCYWIVTEEATRVAGLQTGQYDAANISDTMALTLTANEDVTLNKEEGGQVAIVFNKKEGLFTDQNMRKAVNAIVDADEILVVSYGGSYELGSCYMESNQELWSTDAGSENYNQKDYDAAAQYLADAGYDGSTVRILTANVGGFDKMGEILEMELEAQGIDCELTTVDWSTFTEYRSDSTLYDIYVTSFSSVPTPSLRNYFGANYAGWTDDAGLNDLWSVYNTATSLEDAAAAWQDVQAYCWDYLPIVNLGHYVSNDATNAEIANLIYFNGAYFWNAYIPE